MFDLTNFILCLYKPVEDQFFKHFEKKKEKIMVTSIVFFYFSHDVFLSNQNRSQYVKSGKEEKWVKGHPDSLMPLSGERLQPKLTIYRE